MSFQKPFFKTYCWLQTKNSTFRFSKRTIEVKLLKKQTYRNNKKKVLYQLSSFEKAYRPGLFGKQGSNDSVRDYT